MGQEQKQQNLDTGCGHSSPVPRAILVAILLSEPTGSKLEALYRLCLCVMLQLKQMAPILLHPHHGQELLIALNVCASLLIL